MSTTAWSRMEAERAFTRAVRRRRLASLICRLRRGNRCCGGLTVREEAWRLARVDAGPGVHEIPLDAIGGTLEPNRTAQFDCGFRPDKTTSARWQRVWLAEHRGTVLPPVSVVRVGGAYALRDGHHRVSVAKARGAVSINAVLAGG